MRPPPIGGVADQEGRASPHVPSFLSLLSPLFFLETSRVLPINATDKLARRVASGPGHGGPKNGLPAFASS